MSYILEALKKADAERDRGAVPDLHAQAMLPEAAFEGEPAGRGRPWLWLLAGIGLALIAGVAWQWMGSETPAGETIAAPLPPAAVPPAAPSSVPPAAGDGASRLAQDAAREAASAQVPAKAAGSAPAAASKDKPAASENSEPGAAAVARPRKEGPKVPSEPRAAVAAKDDAKPDAAPAPKPNVKAPSPPAAAERVPLLAELPDDVRRQVPALKLGGLVYSASPASRMVIVNGDVQREGSAVAPGVTLEHIKPKSAVFAIRGQRFEVPL